jgi:hypothetical protein
MIISKYLQPLDVMKRITRQELADHFDEILETVETDSIGYVVKDPEGTNDVVLCPARWFDFCFDEDFGCIVNSALRYAIGRHTYMPSVVRNFIRKYMTVLDAKTLVVAIRDIDSELRIGELDDADEWSLLRSELQVCLDELQEKKDKHGY